MLTLEIVAQLIDTWLKQWFKTSISYDREYNINIKIRIIGTPIIVDIIDMSNIYIKVKEESKRRIDYDVILDKNMDISDPNTNINDIIFIPLKTEIKILYNYYTKIVNTLKDME